MGCPECQGAVATALRTDGTRVVTVGNPNTGKTTLINALAGSNLKVGNWPGTTVDRLEAQLRLPGGTVRLVDLPGAYSLNPTTPEEALAARELLAHPPDVVVNVVDAGNLERNLHLTLELAELGLPMVVALNLMDEAEAKGYTLDPAALERALGVPVVPLVASRGRGTDELLAALERARVPELRLRYPGELDRAAVRLAERIRHPAGRWIALALLAGEEVPIELDGELLELARQLRGELERVGIDPYLEIENARYVRAHELAQDALLGSEPRLTLTDRVDRWVLHPLLGGPIFLLGMLLAFRFTFLFSTPWVDFIGAVQEVLAGWIAALPLPPLVASFFADGLVGGVGTVISFAPVLFFLYVALAFLETSGFLARAAFIADKMMLLAGLPGRAFIPLILGFGCNVPAVYSTRILTGRFDRLRVGLAIPFMSCSARLVVFTLFAAVFFPRHAAWVVFGLYLLGMVVGLLTAWLLGRAAGQPASSGLMELPPYRLPTMQVVLKQAWARTRSFLEGAGGPILLAVLFVWLLLNLPPGDLEGSLYARVAGWLAPLFAPLGIGDWRLLGALIPGFVAKEVVVGTLAVSYLGAEPTAAMGLAQGLGQILATFWASLLTTLGAVPALFGLPQLAPPPPDAPTALQAALRASVAPAAALAYMVYVLLYTPCVATVTALKNEFGRFWAAVAVVYELILAWVLAWGVYRLALLWLGG
ncbi:ferrous iron transport protein B [Oceanithermus sp.]|uniref:ferrous iron transport protein B n=1 Tax=Oceanithermus sp. TaxID=2268145 RepID=UPI00257CE5F4|nr:ferrous iron transport protein B [Oceanithermus sp.]